MPKLRGHHLICLHFFDGEGYDPVFIENLKTTLENAEKTETEICEGKDDVCSKCPYLKNNTCQYNETADEDIRDMDRRALNLLGVIAGENIRWDRIREELPRVFPEWHGRFCSDCEWRKVCERNELFRRFSQAGTRIE